MSSSIMQQPWLREFVCNVLRRMAWRARREVEADVEAVVLGERSLEMKFLVRGRD